MGCIEGIADNLGVGFCNNPGHAAGFR